MDWELVAIFAAITWLEGVRKPPADAVVLACGPGGGWHPGEALEIGRGWRVVAWWPPLELPLVLSASVGGGSGVEAGPLLAGQLARIARPLIVLRFLGGVQLLALVLALPFLTARYGPAGFVAAVAAVLVLGCVLAGTSAWALGRLGASRGERLRAAATGLWPFSAGRPPELLLNAAVAGLPPATVVRQLLRPEDFRRWLRPRAYDVLAQTDAGVDPLLLLLGRQALVDAIEERPPRLAAAEAFCPRCAATYRNSISSCDRCGIPLRGAPPAGAGAGD